MKKILLLVGILLFAGSVNMSIAQPCNFGNLGVKINSTGPGPTPGTCLINFDLYFEIDHNSGGKYFWVHIWPTSSYPAWNYSNPPTTSLKSGGNSALDNSISSFGYFHQGTALTVLTSYTPDANAPGFQSGYTLTEIQGVPDRYTAHNLVITLPQGCNVAQSLTADAWQSQSAASQNIHCVTSNTPFYLNDPTIVGGLLFCQVPRTYKFEINTLSVTDKTVNYQVRIDDGDGIYNAQRDTMIINTGSATINSTSPFQSGVLGYAPYSSTKPYSDKAIWVIVLKNGADIPNDVYARIDNTCAPLPVNLTSFTAQRNKQNVELNWTTNNEMNNQGFYIERKNDNTDWQVISFVPSLALNGISSDVLNYSFTEINNLKAVSQYRLRQVDIDNKFTYSEVRMVKGIDQAGGVLVFPNPTYNGQLTVILDKFLEGANLKLVDMNGHNVKQWDNVRQNRLEIAGVSSGLYLLQVWPKDSKEPLVTKVIVNN